MANYPPDRQYSDILSRHYQEQFGSKPSVIARAPGRINLIGEHTDYNQGLVLPGAIDKAIWLAAGPRTDGRFAFYAADINDHFLSDDSQTTFQQTHSWANYLLGVISEARKDGCNIGGLNLVFGGDVPLGAGLSSSAALESGMLVVLNALFDLHLEAMHRVRLAQRGENHFVGMNCGIMDMFASVMGRQNQVVCLDCRDLSYEYFPFESEEYQLILFDSCVKHTLVDSEYNTRRAECEAGVQAFSQVDPAINSLRDVSQSFFDANRHLLSPVEARRCGYIVAEIGRVREACQALQQHDFNRLGQLMYDTHDGLNEEYQVSIPEINFMVEMARQHQVTGARMMGGGFGGCTIQLIHRDKVADFSAQLAKGYQRVFGRSLKQYPVRLSAGAGVFG